MTCCRITLPMSIIKSQSGFFKKVAVPTGCHQELILMEMSLMSLHAIRHKQKTMVVICYGWKQRAHGHVSVFQEITHVVKGIKMQHQAVLEFAK